jgi:hypothetical protein
LDDSFEDNRFVFLIWHNFLPNKFDHKKFTTLAIALILTSIAFSQKAFTLTSKNLGGEQNKTEEFNGFGDRGKNQGPQLS